eukprot:1161321-Pelagomonas_calceolata.AAC.4
MHAQGRRPYLTLPARENNFVDEKTGLKVADESWYCPKYHHDVTLIMLLVLLRSGPDTVQLPVGFWYSCSQAL